MAEGVSSHVKSAMRTLDVIEFVVARSRPLVAQEIAAALTIPVSSLSYLLSTLVERGYLVREGRQYCAGPGLERLQRRDRTFSLTEIISPLTRTLRVQLNETSSFFVRREWELEALVTEASAHALRYAIQPGVHAGLHSFAAGKALLAAMDEAQLAEYFAQTERRSFTDRTITDETALRQEIARIRERGFARTEGEHTPGIIGLAKVGRLGGSIVGAFSVAIPTVRFDAALEQRAVDLLTRITGMLEAG